MDAFRCSPYPHYIWFVHWLAINPPNIFNMCECRHVTHRLFLEVSGEADVVWATRGAETPFHTAAGDLGFFPCDHETHAMSITSGVGYKAYAVCLPSDQLRCLSTSEGLQPAPDLQPLPMFRDAMLFASLLRLSMTTTSRAVSEDIGVEIAARHVILRLCATVGGRRPEWHRDSSVFTPVVMRRIVEHMDSVLGIPVSLESMARKSRTTPVLYNVAVRPRTGSSFSQTTRRSARRLHPSGTDK